jgi:DNA polymerase-3 subunit epsilon
MAYIAVIDVETTGLNAYRYDRVIELAALVMGLDGEIIREFATLLNPERDIGPTSIHGLTASDIISAPRFAEVAGTLIDELDGCVALAGHNIRFDYSFLSAEFGRLGHAFPNCPTVCTMRLAGGGTLTSCCDDYGIVFHGNNHVALHDALAAAQLLAALLRDAPQETFKIRHLSPITWPSVPKQEASLLTRDESRRRLAKPPTYLQKLFAKAENNLVPKTDDTAILAYTALLDRVLEDRYVDATEAQSLLDVASQWGISGSRIRDAHRLYLQQLVRAALADGIVTDVEQRDLCKVAYLLGIQRSELDEILNTGSRKISQEPAKNEPTLEPLAREQLTGKRVCFTGECQCRHQGQLITREMATALATKRGMTVVESVTRSLDLLVAADPQTQSGKANKAHKYGLRIMHEVVFWKSLGLHVD